MKQQRAAQLEAPPTPRKAFSHLTPELRRAGARSAEGTQRVQRVGRRLERLVMVHVVRPLSGALAVRNVRPLLRG